MRHPSGNQRSAAGPFIYRTTGLYHHVPDLTHLDPRLIEMPTRKSLSPPSFPTLAPLAPLTMVTDPRDEEVPLLNSERLGSHTRIEQTPFPWLQFSIFFALETAGTLTLNTQHPFIPDVSLSHHLNLSI